MLILRVVSGRAWDEETGKAPLSTLQFNTPTAFAWMSESLEGSSGATVQLETCSEKKDTV